MSKKIIGAILVLIAAIVYIGLVIIALGLFKATVAILGGIILAAMLYFGINLLTTGEWW